MHSTPKLKVSGGNEGKVTRAERSAYFARREASKVLQCVLQGDERRQAVASIKSLVFSPTVRNKKATLALVCETLKRLSVIKDVLEIANALSGMWKKQKELMYIIAYDILFGQDIRLVGAAENFLMLQKKAMESALAELLMNKGVKRVEDLMALQSLPDATRPCYVRVNTLKIDLESALCYLGKQFSVQKDDLVPDLLVLPPGTDLHEHPLVKNGSVFVQGKASSMVAVALKPKPDWEVLDACAAPGNKTVHLASLMNGRGKIIACELHKERLARLDDTVRLSGASNVQITNGDFLKLHPEDPLHLKVRAILVDPSCSGSGTAVKRLDHLLPSYATDHGANGAASEERLKRLAAFQTKALTHALSFPAAKRVVYSTCSTHQMENEDVIKSVLPYATEKGFRLAKPLRKWPLRGLPVLEGSDCLLRTDPTKDDKEGFFIALFVRKKAKSATLDDKPRNEKKQTQKQSEPTSKPPRKRRKGKLESNNVTGENALNSVDFG